MRASFFTILILSCAVLISNAEGRKNLQLALATAAFNCDTNFVQIMLDQGADVNGRVGVYDETAFAKGRGLSQIGSETWTPLMAVAASPEAPEKQIMTLAFLLKRGARIDERDSHGASALYIAISNKNFELALNLLKSGANPNGPVQTYIDGVGNQTPLHRAIGSPMVVEALIKYGADVNAKDDKGRTPLDIAESRSYSESARLLRLAPKSRERKAAEK
jgi:ankyrin repeat protein